MSQSDPTLTLELIEEPLMPPATERAIRQLLCECFPADAAVYAHRRAWHDSTPTYTLVSRRADLIVGHLAIVVRTVRCADRPVTVAGVQSFCVAPPYRGTGLAGRLMTRALDEATRRAIPFGLLFCVPRLVPLYRTLGWSKTVRPVAMLDRHGESVPIPEKNTCMLIELGHERFPPGPLDLEGPDW